MCVIAVVKKTLPTLATLKAMQAANDDGAGVAWAQNGMVHYRKGLAPAAILALVKSVRKPVIIHFRLATIGGTSVPLCHPFPMEASAPLHTRGTAKAVLFHNGHMTGWEAPLVAAYAGRGQNLPSGPWSDSRALAALCGMAGPNVLDILGGGSGSTSYNRFALLDGAGNVQLKGGWTKYQGMDVSNTNFCYTAPTSYYSYKAGGPTLTTPTTTATATTTARPSAPAYNAPRFRAGFWHVGGEDETPAEAREARGRDLEATFGQITGAVPPSQLDMMDEMGGIDEVPAYLMQAGGEGD